MGASLRKCASEQSNFFRLSPPSSRTELPDLKWLNYSGAKDSDRETIRRRV